MAVISPTEHYLRKCLNLKPDSDILAELVNYLSVNKYEPDYQDIVDNHNTGLLLNGQYSKCAVSFAEDINPDAYDNTCIVLEEKGILINPESKFHGYTIEKIMNFSITNTGEIDYSILYNVESCNARYVASVSKVVDGSYHLHMFDKALNKHKLVELTSLNDLIDEIESHHILLEIMGREILRKLEAFAKENRNRKSYQV